MSMPTMTISIRSEAYEALRRLKQKGQSFSDVILEHLQTKPATCGELLDELEREFEGVPLADPKLMRAVKEGRGRRSKRPARR